MTTIAIPVRGTSRFARVFWWLVALPWHAIKVYPPVLLIASSAAYASSEFASHLGVFPVPFNYMQAVAFEWVYLGALALAGQKRGLWFYITVAFGAFTSMLYMFLHAADRYGLLALANDAAWRLFYAACHAVPLTLVGVSYMLLIHVHQQDVQLKAEQDADKRDCPYCGVTCKNQQAVYSHYRVCPERNK